MKFQYRPNTSIIDYNKLVKICTFDENGFYETDNPKIIKYLTKKARAVKVVEPVKKPTEEPVKKPTEEKVYKCKKCKFTTPNMGELLAHYRTEHPKK